MIEIHGLRKRLRKRWVLNGIDLTIHDGESIVIIGQSGTGKSVLLKHIMGLMRPDEGSIKIDGEEITTLEGEPQLAVRRRIGYLFQNSALFDSLTVEQNIALAMEPAYILYDEPTTGLDPVIADAINHLIRKLQRDTGVTSITVTHDMKSAYFIADRMAMLHQGRIIFSGTPQETRNAASPIVQQFVEGSSEGPLAAL